MSAPPRRDGDEFRDIAAPQDDYLHTIAVRLAGDPERARDLVQETLARALLYFDQFERGTNVRAWLATILTRVFLDQIKHEKVISKAGPELVTLEDVECNVDMTGPRIPDALLWSAVEALDPDLRAVIERRYLEQMSYKQIGEHLGIPVGTVSTRLKRAHERLKQLLTSHV